MTTPAPGAVVCAVDVGTSAIRAAFVSADGRVIREVRRERRPGEGAVTFSASLLWSDTAAVLAEITREWHGSIASLAIAGHVGTVLVQSDGEPLGVGHGWADTTGVAELSAHWGADQLRSVGRPAVTGGAVPLLTLTAEREPASLRRLRWVLTPKDYLLHRLGASPSTDATTAAYSLALDVREVRWNRGLLVESGLTPEHFPPVRQSTDVIGSVSEWASRLTGLPEGTPLVAGGPDGTVGASAVLGTRRGVVADVAGTTDVLTAITSRVGSGNDPAVTNPYLVAGLWSRGGATGMTGGAVAYWAGLLGWQGVTRVPQSVQGDMESLPPGCHGLSILPTINGSRFPDWTPFEKGAVWGLGELHTPAHILRAAQEAASFLVRHAVEALTPADGSPVLLAGGTARSDSLAQLRADVLGRPLMASQVADVSLLGAALLAHVGAGTYRDLDEAHEQMRPAMRTFEPHAGRSAQYDELYAAWTDTRKCLQHRRDQ